jgi:hypothetical protein
MLAPRRKGMGPKLNFGIKNFQGELSKHFYVFVFFTPKQTWMQAYYNINNLVEIVKRCINLSVSLPLSLHISTFFFFFGKG